MTQRVHRNALQPGYTLHWYRIERVLGHGGFGITYLAWDTNLNQQIAIKEYLPLDLAVREGDHSVHPASGPSGERFAWGRSRFASEGQTLARFDHPSIVRVLAVFEANNTAYMVMRYEHGETLQDRLGRRKTLEEAELLAVAEPVLSGLEVVHAAGFIHRDIKPANIFIREDETPVLLDFGSARQALGQETRTLTTLVSPGYAPFEQYHSKGDKQGPWSDIYGLAATLYRGIAGTPPADVIDRSESVMSGAVDPLVPALEVGEGRYSTRFLRAVDRGLAFRSDDRPRDVAEWKLDFGAPTVPDTGAAAPPTTIREHDDAPTEINLKGLSGSEDSVSAPALAGPKASMGNDVEGFGNAQQEPVTGYLVFGLLSFWAYTAWGLSARLSTHLADRLAELRERLPELGAPEAAPQELAIWLEKGFRAPRAVPHTIAGLYCLDGLLVIGLFYYAVVVAAQPASQSTLFVLTVASLVFYANTVAFVLWWTRRLKGHEQAELRIQRFIADPAAFRSKQPVAGFNERWEHRDNHMALFLILAGPIAFSPAVGLHLFLGGATDAITGLLPITVFALAGVFHAWGTRLLIDTFNGHLQTERESTQP